MGRGLGGFLVPNHAIFLDSLFLKLSSDCVFLCGQICSCSILFCPCCIPLKQSRIPVPQIVSWCESKTAVYGRFLLQRKSETFGCTIFDIKGMQCRNDGPLLGVSDADILNARERFIRQTFNPMYLGRYTV